MNALRVVSVPSHHPYVDQVHDSRIEMVRESDDLAGPWRPAAVFDPDWISEHANEFDVFHLHFGVEGRTVEHVRKVVAALRAANRPLVYTVHDLSNPQLVEQDHHMSQLDVLIPAAAALITLTHGAADAIRQRWGRVATVIAHPRIIDPIDAPDAKARNAVPVVGLHLKDIRPNVGAVKTVSQLLQAVQILNAQGFPVVAQIMMMTHVRDEAIRDEVRDLCSAADRVVLVEHPRYTDRELYDAISSTDVALLPYVHGTHSGWVEMCWDLGVPVVGPTIGFYAEQHSEPGFYYSYDDADLTRPLAQSLGQALIAGKARDRSATVARRRVERSNEHSATVEEHISLYRQVVGQAAAHDREQLCGTRTS